MEKKKISQTNDFVSCTGQSAPAADDLQCVLHKAVGLPASVGTVPVPHASEEEPLQHGLALSLPVHQDQDPPVAAVTQNKDCLYLDPETCWIYFKGQWMPFISTFFFFIIQVDVLAWSKFVFAHLILSCSKLERTGRPFRCSKTIFIHLYLTIIGKWGLNYLYRLFAFKCQWSLFHSTLTLLTFLMWITLWDDISKYPPKEATCNKC